MARTAAGHDAVVVLMVTFDSFMHSLSIIVCMRVQLSEKDEEILVYLDNIEAAPLTPFKPAESAEDEVDEERQAVGSLSKL